MWVGVGCVRDGRGWGFSKKKRASILKEEGKPVRQFRGNDIVLSLRLTGSPNTERTGSIPVQRMLEYFYR